ncbi:MAG: chemotaxis response regulator protein-glutamate methylesterase [Peptostreptococcaceae bacterium]|jgi:two-component system chemotaxis response regulator CheB|nr:chemotaxis response regulator protein-glutamate methylesterase [Peptostreptococcaceae bacterium]
MKKIRVLVVDDSMLFRESVIKELSKDEEIEIIGAAKNPFEARNMIIKERPDVISLDIQMPKMDGIEFLKKLIPQYPIPVVMISSISKKVFEALDAGAVDFVVKPETRLGIKKEEFVKEVIKKIKLASTANVKRLKSHMEFVSANKVRNYKGKLIAIGASTGGTEATSKILRELNENMPGIVIVQHMPKGFTKIYAERLNETTFLNVKEAQEGDIIKPGHVFIAPGEKHIEIRKKNDEYYIKINTKEKVNGHKPSVDVLFKSVARFAGKNAMGVILTGMGKDGAEGLLEMKKNGSYTIGQNKESCVVYGMPKAANDINAVRKQLDIEEISKHITDYYNK